MAGAHSPSGIPPYPTPGSPKSGLPASLLCPKDREHVKTDCLLLEMVNINLFTTQVDAVAMSHCCGEIRGRVSPHGKAHMGKKPEAHSTRKSPPGVLHVIERFLEIDEERSLNSLNRISG